MRVEGAVCCRGTCKEHSVWEGSHTSHIPAQMLAFLCTQLGLILPNLIYTQNFNSISKQINDNVLQFMIPSNCHS